MAGNVVEWIGANECIGVRDEKHWNYMRKYSAKTNIINF